MTNNPNHRLRATVSVVYFWCLGSVSSSLAASLALFFCGSSTQAGQLPLNQKNVEKKTPKKSRALAHLSMDPFS
jgi:hypothetical protein